MVSGFKVKMDPNDFLAAEGMLSPNIDENLSPLLESPLYDFAVPKPSCMDHRKPQGKPMQDNNPQNSHVFRNPVVTRPPVVQIERRNHRVNQNRHNYERFTASRDDAMETTNERLDFFHRVAMEAKAENTRLRQRIQNLEKRLQEHNGGNDVCREYHDGPQFLIPTFAPSIEVRMKGKSKPSLLERRRVKSSLAITIHNGNMAVSNNHASERTFEL